MDAKIAEQKIQLSNEIEKLRLMMGQYVVNKCLSNPENMAISKKIDELVVKYLNLDKMVL